MRILGFVYAVYTVPPTPKVAWVLQDRRRALRPGAVLLRRSLCYGRRCYCVIARCCVRSVEIKLVIRGKEWTPAGGKDGRRDVDAPPRERDFRSRSREVSFTSPHFLHPQVTLIMAPTTGPIGRATMSAVAHSIRAPLRPSVFGCLPHRATFATTGSNALPSPSEGMLGPTGQGLDRPPRAYFQRSRLPINTVINFVPQASTYVVERLGRYHRSLEGGVAVLIPFVDRIAYVKSMKENAMEIPSENVITADNVTLELNGVLYTKVVDARKASYGVEDADYAIAQLAQTTMRSEIGQITLDHVLKERANLNTNITMAINEAAQEWGVQCLRYEIRDIQAPGPVVEAMHRQVTAERSKRAEILESEGQRQSEINLAEGKKQSIILAAEAEAEEIRLKARAIASGSSAAQDAVKLLVAEKYVEAFKMLAKKGTSVIVPGNVGDLGTMAAAALGLYQQGQGQGESQSLGQDVEQTKAQAQKLAMGTDAAGARSGNVAQNR